MARLIVVSLLVLAAFVGSVAGTTVNGRCVSQGRIGACTASPCAGTVVFGLCPGAANIRCCIPQATTTARPAAAAAPARAATPARAAAVIPARAPLPRLGYRCKAFGAIGACKTASSCTNGRSYSGFCSGAASVKCCVPAVTRSSYTGPGLNTITQAAALRLREAEHQTKWAAFKTKNRKRYSSAAVEAQRYAQFKVNREALVHANDRHGKREAIYRSTSPFADISPAVFRSKYLTLQPNAFNARMLLETHAKEAAEELRMLETGSETDSDSDSDVEADDEADTKAEEPEAKSDETEAKSEEPEGKTVETDSFLESSVVPKKPAGLPLGPAKCAAAGGSCSSLTDCNDTGGAAKYDLCLGETVYCCIPPAVPFNQAQLPGRMRTTSGVLTIDYRNIQSPMRDQGDCGSCWAHAAIEQYETAGVRAGKWDTNTQFSVQQLIDCAGADYKANGCHGAVPDAGLNYLSKFAPASEAGYPYTQSLGTCHNATLSGSATPLATYGHVNQLSPPCQGTACTVERMKDALEKYGPMVIAVASKMWQMYGGGVFPDADCTGPVSHAVLLIGYGTELNTATNVQEPFWLVRNSWGVDWGEKGLVRLNAASTAVGCSAATDAIYGTF